ncbi:hypothetical protein [Trebonia sp.]|uniref:hypothetical protein n=1 Tax=Trebonia sp. TaxID=2767075 RepID=UPI002627E389|nr:hypothetical protein [Trebonia sp.]
MIAAQSAWPAGRPMTFSVPSFSAAAMRLAVGPAGGAPLTAVQSTGGLGGELEQPAAARTRTASAVAASRCGVRMPVPSCVERHGPACGALGPCTKPEMPGFGKQRAE